MFTEQGPTIPNIAKEAHFYIQAHVNGGRRETENA
jgi:hypothetical protein